MAQCAFFTRKRSRWYYPRRISPPGRARVLAFIYLLGDWAAMQTSLIIESNGSGKEKLEDLLRDGWTVQSVTANHGKSYNDFLVVLQK